jgi:methionyl-tRNA formyltransferase
MRYLVAGCQPWSRHAFDQTISRYPGEWRFVGDPAELTIEALEVYQPRYVFFLHWSWKVPAEVVDRFECVCFHMTDVPYGRGGSPLQHLILGGLRTTKLTALRMTREIDAGPVYLKEDMSLSGRAQEIYERASALAARMIASIVESEPTPVPQTGVPTLFKRRRPEESEIPPLESAARVYDFIRMLDADGYPRAFIERAGWRYEFRNASLDEQDGDAVVVADVRVSRTGGGGS